MAFFKFRRTEPSKLKSTGRSGKAKASAAATETVESLRRRARHRLIGAAVLVLVAVIGFPLLFDTQPRPVAIDAPIIIPDRDSAVALPAPQPRSEAPVAALVPVAEPEPHVQEPPHAETQEEAATASTGVVTSGIEASERTAAPTVGKIPVNAAPRPQEHEAATSAPPQQGVAETRARDAEAEAGARQEREAAAAAEARKQQEAEAAAREAQARETRARKKREEAQARAMKAEADRALAALEGRGAASKAPASPAAAASNGRFVVQVGAFADDSAVRRVRQQVEGMGLKTYTQVVNTNEGARTTRVRAGPFASRAEAERAAETLKKAGLPGRILEL